MLHACQIEKKSISEQLDWDHQAMIPLDILKMFAARERDSKARLALRPLRTGSNKTRIVMR